MIPIDHLDSTYIEHEQARRFLSDAEYQSFSTMTEKRREERLRQLLSEPINAYDVINDLYFRQKWASLFSTLFGGRPITLLEIASGDADMIPKALCRSNPGSVYITANMNRKHNDSMLRKTEGLPLAMRLVEDDAANLFHHIGEDTADVVAFQHGVNDVIQTILCEARGIDTVYADWMELLPEMIGILRDELRKGTFEASVRPALCGLFETLGRALKPGGLFAVSHYMFQLDLELGYPADLFEGLLDIVRPWLLQTCLFDEIQIPRFEPHWWMFLRKRNEN